MTDLRFAVRRLAQTPGFTILAVVTLALGIGANSALFTLADSILRRPRPGVRAASDLVWIAATSRIRSRPTGLSYQVARRIRDEVPSFAAVATIRDVQLAVASGGTAMSMKGQAVSGDYFSLLGVTMARGRGITRADDQGEGDAPVAVLSHAIWQQRFDGDSSILGRAVTLNGLAFTIIGIAPPGFNGAEHDDAQRALWVPASMLVPLVPQWREMAADPASSDVRVIARLRSPDTRSQARAQVQRLGSTLVTSDSTRDDGWQLHLYDASAGMPAGGDRAVAPITALAVAVTGVILFLCCANVSNLLLARALGRRREIATRLALGASRMRIVRQLLTESLVLAAIAGAAGLLLASWTLSLLVRTTLALPVDVALHRETLVVSAALALFSALLFGLAPALHATRAGVAKALRDAGTGGTRTQSRLQGSLVIAQVAASFVLLSLAGLFARSLMEARRTELGFDARENVVAVSFDLGLLRYDSVQVERFMTEALDAARALPQTDGASLTSLLPLTEWSLAPVIVADRRSGRPLDAGRVTVSAVAPSYFRAIGTPLLAGRDFGAGDAKHAPRVAIVGKDFAARYANGSSPLGMRISLDGEGGPWWTIVGVAGPAVVGTLATPSAGALYLPLAQRPARAATLIVRSVGGSARHLAGPLRATLTRLAPDLPIDHVRTMAEVREGAASEQRAGARILSVLGILALALAILGLYGVMHFTVRSRTRELGIRLAIGATGDAVVRLVVRRGMQLTMAGCAAGTVLAIGAGALARSLLFGVSTTDAATFTLVPSIFVVVALVACWLPARRASRITPTIALRSE